MSGKDIVQDRWRKQAHARETYSRRPTDANHAAWLTAHNAYLIADRELLKTQARTKDDRISKLEDTVRALRKSHGFKEAGEKQGAKLYAFRNADAEELANVVFNGAGK